MRYGIFSDVHSNLEALDSVLADCASERIDRFFCVGDIVGYGADPVLCLSRLRALPVVSLAGNHDWAVSGRLNAENFSPDAREAAQWTAERLDGTALEFLSSLRLVHSEDPLTLVHGTLNDPAEFSYLEDISDAAESFALLRTQLCFVGHTHMPGIFSQDRHGKVAVEPAGKLELGEGLRYIVNVGSVGQPRDRDPRAAYCVFDSGGMRLEIKRTSYDAAAARRKIIAAGLPGFLGDRLLLGR